MIRHDTVSIKYPVEDQTLTVWAGYGLKRRKTGRSGTHNPLVEGSSPSGPTITNNGLRVVGQLELIDCYRFATTRAENQGAEPICYLVTPPAASGARIRPS